MAREGVAYLVVCIIVAVFFFAAGHRIVSALFIVPFLFIVYFFRDPDRTPPVGEELLVSPADGKVISIETVDPSGGLAGAGARGGVRSTVKDITWPNGPTPASLAARTRHSYFPSKSGVSSCTVHSPIFRQIDVSILFPTSNQVSATVPADPLTTRL